MFVREAMTPKVEWATPETPIKDLAVKMRDLNIGCLPVEEGDQVIGMITDRDITCRVVAEGFDPATTMARDIMSKDVAYVFEDQDLDEAAHLMEDRKIRRLPVLDRERHVTGLLALGDLSQKAPETLSGEIVKTVFVHH
jgi:CBS domain-containing protein